MRLPLTQAGEDSCPEDGQRIRSEFKCVTVRLRCLGTSRDTDVSCHRTEENLVRLIRAFALGTTFALTVALPVGAAAANPASASPKRAAPASIHADPDSHCVKGALGGIRSGTAAIAELGDKIGAAAQEADISVTEYKSRLTAGSDIQVDPCGRMFSNSEPVQGTELASSPATTNADVFTLASRPGSTHTIHLDFDGVDMTGSWFTSLYNKGQPFYAVPYDVDGNPGSFSAAERATILRTWQVVAEDFAPFDVNVTTIAHDPAALTRTDAADDTYGLQVPITMDQVIFSQTHAAGHGYMDQFDAIGAAVPRVMSVVLGQGAAASKLGDVTSHEIGHNFGLEHNGVVGGRYDGNGRSPILGAQTTPTLTWTNGDYPGSFNQDDEVAQIASNGAPVMPDDYADNASGAHPIAMNSTTNGLISTRADVDVFSFNASGDTTVEIAPEAVAPNLDTQLTIRNAAGTAVAAVDPKTAVLGKIGYTFDAAPGSYTAEVDGVGLTRLGVQEYSDYSSLGRYTIAVSDTAPPIGITLTAAPDVAVGSPVYAEVTTTGGVAPLRWTATGLPAGLALNEGVVTGTPTASGNKTATISVTDARGKSVTATLVWKVQNKLAITTASLLQARAGNAYTTRMAWSGGSGTLSWTLEPGSELPVGLTLSNSGNITGTPRTTGTASVAVRARDYTFGSAVKTVSLTVLAPYTEVATSLAAALQGAAYSEDLQAAGSGPFSWAVLSGTLPDGLSLATNGTIAGTPTTPGISAVSFRVTDSLGRTTDTASMNLAVETALRITTTTLPGGFVNSDYSVQLAAAGGLPSYRWKLSQGALPAGLTTGNGKISGRPTAIGTSTVAFEVTDSLGTVRASVPLTIAVDAIAVSTNLPMPVLQKAYSATLQASGGTGPYTWTNSAGGMPAGLKLAASTGAITGTPTAAATTNSKFRATDSLGRFAEATVTFAVDPLVRVSTIALDSGRTGSPYSATLQTDRGTAPFTWAVASGTLPAGLTLSAGGTISGTPAAEGTSSLVARATDAHGLTGDSRLLTLTVESPVTVTTTELAGGLMGSPYTAQLAAKAGTAPYSWALSSGTLPPGVTLDASGAISGTPVASGTSSAQFRVTDAEGGTAGTGELSLTVESTLAITSGAPGDATAGNGYGFSLAATGGKAPYSWTAASATLPAGLTMTKAGKITGTPQVAGTAALALRVTDASGAIRTFGTTLRVKLRISTDALPAGPLKATYSPVQLMAVGGTGTLTWVHSGGTMVPGMTLAGDGTLSGKPAKAGSWTFGAKVTDANGETIMKPLTVKIG